MVFWIIGAWSVMEVAAVVLGHGECVNVRCLACSFVKNEYRFGLAHGRFGVSRGRFGDF